MKTQTYGVYDRSNIDYYWSCELFGANVMRGCENEALKDYRNKRDNGNDSDNPNSPFPKDGTFQWIKGTVKDNGDVYGVKENDGYYHYEVKYVEGPGDKKWMAEKDKNYLDRLEKEGKLKKVEPEEFKKRQAKKSDQNDELKQLTEEKKPKKHKKKKPEKEKQRKEELEQIIQEKVQKAKDEENEKLKKTEEKNKLLEEELKKFKNLVDQQKQKEPQQKVTSKDELKDLSNVKIVLPKIPYKNLTLDRDNPLGSGGFGTVYKGTWYGQKVAVKELHVQTTTVKNEFVHEATMLAKFSFCPLIIKIHGVCIDPNHYGLVMELSLKGSLYDLLHNYQDLPWKIRYQITMDITNGLHYLHDQSTVHRDLKSQNVLLDDKLRAKLCDFGLAKTRATTSISAKNKKGKDNDSVGTIPWMAPELFGPHPKYTKASDMYSYGMVLWEITSRDIPWKDTLDIKEWVVKGDREIIPDKCPKSFAALITKCWKQRGDERPKIEDAEKDLTSNEKEIKGYV